ncbi:unnamed protein product [Closterium sp. NIES-53]
MAKATSGWYPEVDVARHAQAKANGCATVQVGPIICVHLRACALLSSTGQRWTAALLQRWHTIDLLCWQVAFLQCWRGSSTQRWHAVDHAELRWCVKRGVRQLEGGWAEAAVVWPAAPVVRRLQSPVAQRACCASSPWVRCSCRSELAADPVTPVVRRLQSPVATVRAAPVARVSAASLVVSYLHSSHSPSSSSLALCDSL